MEKSFYQSHLGHMRQLASIKRVTLDEGWGRGMRCCQVNNGSGLSFNVYPDRALDIIEAAFQGIPLVWQTSAGPVHPAFYNEREFEWLRSWPGGLLTSCGLLNVGGPNRENGLHGRLAHTPGEAVNTECDWNEAGKYELAVSGKFGVSRVFGEKLMVSRRISTALGDNRIVIEDQVENQGFAPAEFLQLYHMNYGWPLVDEGIELVAPEHRVTPQNDIARAGLSEWRHFGEPVADFTEQVFYHDLPVDVAGMASIELRNPKLKLALSVSYNKAELPYLVQWKQQGCGEYVMGLEPGNALPEGAASNREKGITRILQPGEIAHHRVVVALRNLE